MLALGNESSALPWVKKWATVIIIEENVDSVWHMVIDEKRLNIHQIANGITISRVKIEYILSNKLSMTMVSTWLVRRLLTPGQ